MLVGDKLSHDAASEAYILLTAYIREEGKVADTYDTKRLTEFANFLADILKHPENFIGSDGSLKSPDTREHDGLGLA